MNIFGYSITKKEKTGSLETFQIEPDSAIDVSNFGTSGIMSYNYDLVTVPQGEIELIKTYRRISLSPDIDLALGEIKNEAFVFDVPGRRAFEPTFTTECKLSDDLKQKITDETNNLYNIIDFNNNGLNLFMEFYVDGKTYLHKVVDKSKPKEGIQKIISIDPLKIKKIRELPQPDKDGIYDITKIKEYYVFQQYIDGSNNILNPTTTGTGLIISTDSIAYTDSGIRDKDSNIVVGFLYKAIIPYNNLKLMEDSSIVLRVSRSPERRVIYVDVGNLPKSKAEQYVKDLMNRFKTKMVYDSKTGSVVDRKNILSMVEDYWLPRREGGRGTEIETLPGCLAMDTQVSLLDGRELSIREIEMEMNNGRELWTYSCDPLTGEVVPGLISWAGVTQKSAKVLRLTLDNGETIVCTPDHKFPVYGKGFIRADELSNNSSIIPLYRRKKDISPTKKLKYEEIFDNKNKKWVFTHRMINKNISLPEWRYNESCEDDFVLTHHIDCNRFNNSPNNLCRMSWIDHSNFHKDRGFDEESTRKGLLAAKIKKDWMRENDPEEYDRIYAKPTRDGYRKWFDNLSEEEKIERNLNKVYKLKNHHENLTDLERIERDKICIKNLEKNAIINKNLWTDSAYRENQRIKHQLAYTTEWRENKSKIGILAQQRFNDDPIKYANKSKKITEKQKLIIDNEIFCSIIDCIAGKTTHQVTIQDVVDLLNSNAPIVNKFKSLNKDKSVPNFNLDDGFAVGILRRCPKDFGYDSWFDLRQKCKNHNHRIISIEWLDAPIEVGTLTIDGNELYHNHHTFALTAGVFTKNSDNIGVITDLEYFRNNLYQSLNIPPSRFKEDSGAFSFGKSTEINRDEYRFKKFLNRVRQRFMFLFEDLLKTQLILKKIISSEDWEEIRRELQWSFTEDNAFVEYKESEIIMNRVETLQAIDSFVGKYFTEEWVMKNILKYSTEEIKDVIDARPKPPADDSAVDF